ncbi:hypothetical protein [Streptomyces pinistramenti]|uniref:hypothetical protein n=1 Tax=Streptomyces pinistramenti TaxID=2884812 RepID=UPI001D083CE9|nr:hypothetical protein [Streptomyces pinistramenti]MCB5912275.1 hypothetical protein [Streptomyces pinistramenti]
MSYRTGIYVIDRRTGRLGRVMGCEGTYLQLRPPGGGIEWDCPPGDARLSTARERRAAGIRADEAEPQVPAS